MQFFSLLLVVAALAMKQGKGIIPERFEGALLGSLSFTVAAKPGVCHGGPTAGLGSTALRLDYRGSETNFHWRQISDAIPLPSNYTSTGMPVAVTGANAACVQFRLVQEEHGGGGCNCWQLRDPVLNNSTLMLYVCRLL